MKVFVRLSMIPVLQVLLLMTVAPLAAAYIGPGSGISVIGSLLGLLVTILITVGAIALFPFRKMMKKHFNKQAPEGVEDEFSPEPEDPSLDPVKGESVNTK